MASRFHTDPAETLNSIGRIGAEVILTAYLAALHNYGPHLQRFQWFPDSIVPYL